MCVYIYIYIYIYTHCLYIYIYIHIYWVFRDVVFEDAGFENNS